MTVILPLSLQPILYTSTFHGAQTTSVPENSDINILLSDSRMEKKEAIAIHGNPRSYV